MLWKDHDSVKKEVYLNMRVNYVGEGEWAVKLFALRITS
jgi:hypothetical protein